MKRNLISWCAALFLFTNQFAVLPQSVKKMSAGEPFRLDSGSSFAASRDNIAARSGAAISAPERITADVGEALEVIRNNYVGGDKLDYGELINSSISAMLRTLDPHSNYFDAAEYSEMLTEQQSEYSGIGATIANYRRAGREETFVVATFPDAPATRAGLRFGDKITAVEGKSAAGKSSAEVRDLVRGKRGSTVRITVERAATGKTEIVAIKRNRVPSPTIPDAYLLRENIGYIDLSGGFNYTTGEELNAALEDLEAQGMNSLILDLRGNPGGILQEAVKVAEKFLKRGDTILTQRGRFTIDNRVWKSSNPKPETYPLVVLVNGDSASASEIVAGALQDYDRALIIGEKTFGKGLVQSIIDLPYNSGMTLTTARYYTPSGRSIQRDYSHSGIYDYFRHRSQIDAAAKTPAKTATGRTIYGGDGIAPDEVVKSEVLDNTAIELIDPLFYFAREVANGKVAGFENLRSTIPVVYGQRIGRGEFRIDDELFIKFKDFVAAGDFRQIDTNKLNREKKYIEIRLRILLATAKYGNIAANQILIESDEQVRAAINALPRAGQLAKMSRKSSF